LIQPTSGVLKAAKKWGFGRPYAPSDRTVSTTTSTPIPSALSSMSNRAVWWPATFDATMPT